MVCITMFMVGGVFLLSSNLSKDSMHVNADITGVDNQGSGTSAGDPKLVGTIGTLRTVAGNSAIQHIVIINNIAFSGASIAVLNNCTIDGQGFEITGLTVSLFTQVTGSTIKNLTTKGAVVGNGIAIGSLAGTSIDSTFINCHNYASISRLGTTASNRELVNGGLVGVANGSLNIDKCSNSGKVFTPVNANSAEASGGIVGTVNTNTTAIIKHSRNNGEINGLRSGGIVGKMGGTGTLTIQGCLNSGKINNTMDSQLAAGGILAWAMSSAGTTFIESCMNTAYVTVNVTNGDKLAYPSGIFSFRTGGDVFIENCYNEGNVFAGISYDTGGSIRTDNNVVLEGTERRPSPSGSGGVFKTQEELESPYIILDTLGDEYCIGIASMRPVLKAFTETTLLFDSNGGKINNDTEILLIKATDLNNDTVESITRPGYQFIGWHIKPELGSDTIAIPVTSYIDPSVHVMPNNWWGVQPLSESNSYFAIWQEIEYKVIGTVGTSEEDLDTANQLFNLYGINGTPVISNLVAIGRELYMQTFLSGTSGEDFYFKNWDVKNKDGEWNNLGAGYEYTGSGASTKEQRYKFDVDEIFISNYTRYEGTEWTISFRATYVNKAPNYIYVTTKESIQSYWGKIKIDNTENFKFDSSFSREKEVETFTAIVTANKYYEVIGYEISVDGGEWRTVILTEPTDTYTFTENIEDKMVLCIIFAPQKFNIRIETQTEDGVKFDGKEQGAYRDNGAPVKVDLQTGDYGGITLLSGSSYRPITNSSRNIKIYNQLTQEYDLHSAVNGNVRFNNIDEKFFDKYVNKETNEIVIIAMFYKQVALTVDMTMLNDEEEEKPYGEVYITITDKRGVKNRLRDGFVGYYDEGSSVEITITLREDARVSSIDNLPAEHVINKDRTVISFKLTEIIEIFIHFDEFKYDLTVIVRDDEGQVFDYLADQLDIEIIRLITEQYDSEGEDIWEEITFKYDLNDGGGLLLTDVIMIKLPESESRRPKAWYIIVNDKPWDVEWDAEKNAYIIDIAKFIAALLTDGITDYFNFVLEARFSSIGIISFSEKGNGETQRTILDKDGKATEEQESVKGEYSDGTQIRLSIKPAPFHRFDVFEDGEIIYTELTATFDTAADEYFINVIVSGAKNIAVIFAPEKKTITVTNTTVNGEKFGIGDTIRLKYKPKTFFQRDTWTINGMAVSELKNYKDAKASVSNTAVTFVLTAEIMSWLEKDNFVLNSKVTEKLSTITLIAIAAIAAAIVAAIGFVIWIIYAGKRRKEDYKKALELMKIQKARMGHADLIKNLREGNDGGIN